ncbi:MAG: glycosyltransferase family 4 protein [Candidatus Pacebacteria bacterium]|jgi:glycosyltransferase involved in cell wall biosynthesis|nr:glycosyltransferase family 4 protein [Candidatus Paceibacterota bacterium]
MKKKILFVITKSNFGGAQKYVFDLARSLPKDQFEVAVATGGNGPLLQKLQGEHVRIIPILSLTRDIDAKSDLAAFFELLAIFKKEQPDVVHLNSAKAGGVGALAARLARVPEIIFTAHGWAFNEDRPCWQRTLIKFFSWITTALTHHTIAVSDAIKKDTSWWPLVGDKIVVIKNGIAKPDFYTKEDARQKLFTITKTALPKDAQIIGTIAELHKSKGLQYAIEAFSKIASQNPSLYYFILGDGDERENLEKTVTKYGLKNRVIFAGFVDDAARLLPAFDIFVLPSITEALGLVLLEAGFTGLPVIATNVGGIPEIIGNETGILVPTRNPEMISKGISDILSNKEYAGNLARMLQAHVTEKFSLKRMITETSALYTGKQG